jgi:hypothetical protein
MLPSREKGLATQDVWVPEGKLPIPECPYDVFLPHIVLQNEVAQ